MKIQILDVNLSMTNFQDWVENAVYPHAVDLIDMTEFEPFFYVSLTNLTNRAVRIAQFLNFSW